MIRSWLGQSVSSDLEKYWVAEAALRSSHASTLANWQGEYAGRGVFRLIVTGKDPGNFAQLWGVKNRVNLSVAPSFTLPAAIESTRARQ